MRLGRTARRQLEELIVRAAPLTGDFFRSVAFRYFHPDDVISGQGTYAHGGRFVPKGVKAVYASLDEETAMREVTDRKAALRGRRQIRFRDYPRMTYILTVRTRRNIDLSSNLPSALSQVVGECVQSSNYAPSQELASVWIGAGIESVVFPSATGVGRNVVVYLNNAEHQSVVVRNREQVLAMLRRIPRKRDI